MGKTNKRQLGLFSQEKVSTLQEDGVPVYRISLVREGTLCWYNKQIRSSADASAVLHEYLDAVDREYLCAASAARRRA